ncbi:MAG TPA: tail fiber protein [Pyrinomonadaceae bacterium]|jgi:microcystin-dependent protein
MPEPYVGEIRMFGGNFPPNGWMFCEGALLPISENEVLFNLIGTAYGGDGQSTFALPDLRGRVPMHQGTFAGQNFVLGENGGVESVTLTTQQIPVHNHALIGSNTPAVTQLPGGNIPAQSTGLVYTSSSSQINMYNQSISPVGGSQPHENMQPYLCISFIISLFGIYPPPQ